MKAQFNPYTEWLGLPKNLAKPNLYQLLGLKTGEPDVAKIEKAAMERMKRVRSYQVLPEFSAVAIRVGNELGEALAILSDAAEKQRYDKQWRSQETHLDEPSANDTWENLPATSKPKPPARPKPVPSKPPRVVQPTVVAQVAPSVPQAEVPAEVPASDKTWVWWLLLLPRGVDWLLASVVGEDNEILHNFMRFVCVVVLLGGSYFGVSSIQWEFPKWNPQAAVASNQVLPVVSPVAHTQPSPWLFDGETFAGWQGDQTPWKIEAGTLTCDTSPTLQRAVLRHEQECGPHVLRFFCKQHSGNCSLLLGGTDKTGLEIYLTGTTACSVWSESLSQYVVQPKLNEFNQHWRAGQWNEWLLLHDGHLLKLLLNGKLIFEYELDTGLQLPEATALSIQVGGLGEASKVEFRDLERHPLPQFLQPAANDVTEFTPIIVDQNDVAPPQTVQVETPPDTPSTGLPASSSPPAATRPPPNVVGPPSRSTPPMPFNVTPPRSSTSPFPPGSPGDLVEQLRNRSVYCSPRNGPDNEVQFVVSIVPGKADLETLKLVAQLPRVSVLMLLRSQITPEMIELISTLKDLEVLNLSDTSVTNSDLAQLSKLNNLLILTLRRTQINDEGLVELSRMTQLKQLDLLETQATSSAVSGLRAQLRNCRISGP